MVRGALGAAFFRAVRFIFLRSALSVIDFVFAIRVLVYVVCVGLFLNLSWSWIKA